MVGQIAVSRRGPCNLMPMVLRLGYMAAFDWDAALQFFERRAIAGVEAVMDRSYARTIQLGSRAATCVVRHDAAERQLVCSVAGDALPAVEVTRRLRSMFDLDADLVTINASLCRDPQMAPLVDARPAVRVFHGWDGFEVAIRSIVGQQVSVRRARDLNGVLAERCGSRLPGGATGLDRLFPTPSQVLDGDLDRLGMPGARALTLGTMARAVLADPELFSRGASIEETTARLRAVKGVGDWTAHYIAMRACAEPDAFPASDVGLLRGAAGPDRPRPSPRDLLARAAAWRPWRAYAAHHLWAIDPG